MAIAARNQAPLRSFAERTKIRWPSATIQTLEDPYAPRLPTFF
ncbi:hypothetical protein [Actinoallomurus soli]|nr:hypothetical protein [Actinoallomurus soli]